MNVVDDPMLTNDAFLHTFGFLPGIDLSRLGATCRSWRELICSDDDRSRQLWEGVIEGHHLNKGEDADLFDCDLVNICINLIQVLGDHMDPGNLNPDFQLPPFERRLVVLLENKIFGARCRLRDELAWRINERTRDHPTYYGSEATSFTGQVAPSTCPCLPTRKKGTTSTFSLKAHGKYFAPVYYDWEENWGRVAELVRSDEVQKVLRRCVDFPYQKGDYESHYGNPWSPKYMWPFYFCGCESIMSDESHTEDLDATIEMLVPDDWKRDHNERVAKRMESEAKILADKELNNLSHLVTRLIHDNLWDILDRNHRFWEDFQNGIPTVEDIISYLGRCVEHDFETNVLVSSKIFQEALSIEKVAKDIVDDMTDTLNDDDLFFDFRGKNLEYLFPFTDGGPLRSTLLCTMDEPHTFLPLNYKLAQLLSPPGTELKIYVSDDYAVVFDEKRNIIFDNLYFYYHHTKKPSASKVLSISRDSPQIPAKDFDYTLGGLRVVESIQRKRKRAIK